MVAVDPTNLNIASWFIYRYIQEHPEQLAILSRTGSVPYLLELVQRVGDILLGYSCDLEHKTVVVLPTNLG